MMKVDIIIPVYNALEDLQKCLASIYRHTDFVKHRLILINDNSSDNQVRPYLDTQIQENIIVIHNESNKGFSHNINLGISQSDDRDVILLNSDTIVTKNWIEKMLACAYSDSSIGTVTPLSNNATLCSVPDFCENNTLPEGMDIDQAGRIVEECSMKKYPRITVANGFCMLVKREVIRLIGNFDATTFGRGYGEENDFCNRTEQMGYIHVMCDDTYIYHSGTKSFVSKEKAEYIQAHEKILMDRYPVQMYKNMLHCQENPNGWVGRNIAYHFDIRNGRKNILFLLQSDFKEGADDNVGGTQIHVKHLTMGLRNQMNIYVVARNREYLQVTAYIGEKEHPFQFYIGEPEAFPLWHDRKMAELFRLLSKEFHIDLVHVHHTASTSPDIFQEADKLNIPVIYTLHDFFPICPCVKLLDAEGNFCLDQAPHDCASCLAKRQEQYQTNNYLDLWRKKWEVNLKLCKCIIVPSKSAEQILKSSYSDLKTPIKVIEHGIEEPQLLQIDESRAVNVSEFLWRIEKFDAKGLCPFLVGVAYLKEEPNAQYKIALKVTDSEGKKIYLPTNYGKNPDILQSENRFYAYLPNSMLAEGDIKIEAFLLRNSLWYKNSARKETLKNILFRSRQNFRVAFIGGINEEKGGTTICDIIENGPEDVEWYIFGGIGQERLYKLHRKNLVKTGFYHSEDLHTLLTYHQIDAVCILSKWPETFSYTLSEALCSHLPVIVTNIGALGQRVSSTCYGKLVSVKEETVQEVLQCIEQWKNKGIVYQHAKAAAEEYSHDTLSDMLTQYNELYTFIISNTCKVEEDFKTSVPDLYRLNLAHDLGLGLGKNDAQSAMKISELENRLKIIDNSITYKLVLKLTSVNIPFKKQLKSILTRQKRGSTV